MNSDSKVPGGDKKGPKKNRSLGLYHGEAAGGGVETAASAYQGPSLIACGADAQDVAMLSTYTNLVFALLCAKVPAIIKKVGSRKKTVALLALIDAITWVPLVGVLWFIGPVNPLWLILLWVLNLIPGMLIMPARDSWLADMVPGNRMGRYLGLRSAIAGIAYLGSFYVMGYMLDVFYGQAVKGFAFVFLMAGGATIFTAILYCLMRNTSQSVEEDSKFGFKDFLKETRTGNLGKYILFVSSFNFAVYLSAPLFGVYMLTELHFSYLMFSIVISAEYLAKIMSARFWGRYADSVGHLKVLSKVSHIIPFIPILWLASSNVAYLIFVQLLAGVAWAGFELCSQSFLYKASPPARRLKYIVYNKTLTTLFMAMGAMTGAYLVTSVFHIHGSALLGVFLISGVLRFVVVRLMIFRVKDTTEIPELWQDRPVEDYAPVAGLALSRSGLFYRPQQWRGLPASPAYEAPATSLNLGLAATRRRGFFYRRDDWARFADHPAPESPAGKEAPRAVASHRGFFYQPQVWPTFVRGPVSEGGSVVLNIGPASFKKRGLFYQAEGWERYMKHSAAKASPSPARTAPPRRWGFFYRPQAWSTFVKRLSSKEQRAQSGKVKPAAALA